MNGTRGNRRNIVHSGNRASLKPARTVGRRKGQAAITDAIILLLISTFASSLIFAFVGNWGNDHDAVLRSSYVLNYMQSVSKTMYYVDASQLSGIGADGLDIYKTALMPDGSHSDVPGYDLNSSYGCRLLAAYPGTLRVTDLLKRDLSDSNPKKDSSENKGPLPKLDDKFGSTADAVVVPGRTAMRCTMKELMKPFAFSGYKYYMEVLSLEDPVEAEGDVVPYLGPEITNSRDLEVVGVETGGVKRLSGNGKPGCNAASSAGADGRGYNILSISSPFQVLYSTTSIAGQLSMELLKYKTRICIWQSREGV